MTETPPPLRRTFLWPELSILLVITAMVVLMLTLHVAPQPKESLRSVTPGQGWVAFERCVERAAARDTVLYLAKSIDDRSTWVRIAPDDLPLLGAMQWTAPHRLSVPALFRDGCIDRVEDVQIEWRR